MPQLRLGRERIRRFLERAADALDGDWLLIGGAAAALWFREDRVTEDIDLVGLGDAPGARLALLELADEEGLPIEAVNSAADFFVRRVDGWRDRLELLLAGARGTIYRPDPTLFLLLKLRRLSETDLDDCLALLVHVAREGAALDRDGVSQALAALPATEDERLRERRKALGAALGG
jgi:hypothetical protein